MTSDAPTIVGRTAEIDVVRRFVDSLEQGPSMLVVTGEPGIGKSTVWREGLRLAEERGFGVMQCRPVQSEAQLAFTALSDLLAELPPPAFEMLPDPQRRALEVALLRAEPNGDELLPRAVGLGVLGVLREQAASQPIVLGIDDAHWLDQASQRVLAFVLRRLRRERVGVLVASRPDARPSLADELDVDAWPWVTLHLGALDDPDLEQILRSRLGQGLGRRSLTRLQNSSGGNPLFALQIGRALIERDSSDDEAELSMPASLQQIVGDRLSGLGPAISAVQAAAALSRPTATLIEGLCGTRGRQDIQLAVGAGVLTLDGDRLAFTHPLLATAAYAQLGIDDKRRLHKDIAALLDDVEERARHLAIATEHPDAEVARALDVAARRARARCAPDTAAELWEAAARLSPVDQADAARARRLQAALCLFEAGDVARARAVFDDILDDAPPGPTRARALVHHAWTVAHIDGFEAGARAFRAALAEMHAEPRAPIEPQPEIELQQGLAWCLHNSSRLEAAEPPAAEAVAIAERSGDSQLIGVATTLAAFLRSLAGEGLAVETVGRVAERNEVVDWCQILCRPSWLHGMLIQWEDRLVEANEHFQRLHDDAIARGDEHALPFILFHLARTQLLIGNWSSAQRSAAACADTTHSSGQLSERPFATAIVSLVQAHLGEIDTARALIAEGLALAEQFGVQPAALEMLATRGFLDISVGHYDDADRTFEEVGAMARNAGLLEPALFRYHGDAIEAKIGRGRLDEAEALLETTQALASRLERPWLELIVARGSGLLEAARGRLDEASEMLAGALDDERVGQPFERARTQLVLGSVHRRNRKKRAARDALTAAAENFERLGARLWVERAASELARIGGRAPSAVLTPTERQVAELIAAGRTYREAAAELFISPKTVQWNLSKVYSKLGIRSRAELPGRLHRG